MRKWNIGLAAFFILLASSIFYNTREYAVSYGDDPGAAYWPRILAVILTILSIAMAVQSMLNKNEKDGKASPINFKAPEMKRVYAMLVIFILFAVLLYFGGFVIASLLFIPAVMFVLGERKAVKIVLASIILTGVVYFFFTILLRITLPQPFFM